MARSGNPYGAPRDSNRVPAMMGVSSTDGKTMLPLEINQSTGRALVDATVSPSTNPTSPVNGQQTATGTAAALPSGALVNGVIVQALSTNTASVYVGKSGVTTATGFELQPGQATSAAVADLSDLYIVGNGQSVCWIGS